MKKIAASVCLALPLGGCASAFTAITDRAIVAEKLNKPTDQHKAIAVAGDRRLVRFTRLETAHDTAGWLVCAEPFAGAVSARAANSALELAEKGKASDSFTETALASDQRSPADPSIRMPPTTSASRGLQGLWATQNTGRS